MMVEGSQEGDIVGDFGCVFLTYIDSPTSLIGLVLCMSISCELDANGTKQIGRYHLYPTP